MTDTNSTIISWSNLSLAVYIFFHCLCSRLCVTGIVKVPKEGPLFMAYFPFPIEGFSLLHAHTHTHTPKHLSALSTKKGMEGKEWVQGGAHLWPKLVRVIATAHQASVSAVRESQWSIMMLFSKIMLLSFWSSECDINSIIGFKYTNIVKLCAFKIYCFYIYYYYYF